MVGEKKNLVNNIIWRNGGRSNMKNIFQRSFSRHSCDARFCINLSISNGLSLPRKYLHKNFPMHSKDSGWLLLMTFMSSCKIGVNWFSVNVFRLKSKSRPKYDKKSAPINGKRCLQCGNSTLSSVSVPYPRLAFSNHIWHIFCFLHIQSKKWEFFHTFLRRRENSRKYTSRINQKTYTRISIGYERTVTRRRMDFVSNYISHVCNLITCKIWQFIS